MRKASFFRMVPDRKPRTECACQSVAFMIAASVAPSGRFSRSRILAALLPSRAIPAFLPLLGAFFAALAFLPDLPFLGAAWAERAPALAFLLALGCAVAVAAPVSSLVSVVIVISLGGVSAIT